MGNLARDAPDAKLLELQGRLERYKNLNNEENAINNNPMESYSGDLKGKATLLNLPVGSVSTQAFYDPKIKGFRMFNISIHLEAPEESDSQKTILAIIEAIGSQIGNPDSVTDKGAVWNNLGEWEGKLSVTQSGNTTHLFMISKTVETQCQLNQQKRLIEIHAEKPSPTIKGELK